MKNGESNKFSSDYIPSKYFLTVLGIWPKNVNYFWSLVRFLLVLVINISCMCSASVELYRQCVSMDDLIDAFSLFTGCLNSILKLLIYRIKSQHSRALIDSVTEDWSIVKDARHVRIMTDFLQRGKFAFSTFLYTCYIAAPVFVFKLNSFDKHAKKQIMKFFGVTTNGTSTLKEISPTTCVYGVTPWYLRVWIVMLQMIQVSVMVVIQCGSDPWFFTLVMHLCGQFKILRMNLEEMRFEDIGAYKNLGLLVERHCHLVKLTYHLEEHFNSIVLVQMCWCVMIGCLEGFVFLLSLQMEDNVGAFKSMSMLFLMLVQLYMFAHAGDLLESHAQGVAEAVYSSPWYFLRGKSAKDIVPMISRGHISCTVSVGKFVPMNRFTFKEALKITGSYLSVLRVRMQA